MSDADDVRKAVQDVWAPVFNALDTRLSALEKAVDNRFTTSGSLVAARHELIVAELRTAKAIADSRHEAILKGLNIDKRLEKIEAREAAGA